MRLQPHTAFQHFAVDTMAAALHAETRAAHSRDGDRRAHFETAYTLAGGRDARFDAAALDMDD